MATASNRERLRQQQEAQRQAAQRRKVIGILAGALALILIFVVVFWAVGRSNRNKAANTTTSGQVLAAALTSVPASEFDTVGVATQLAAPKAISGGTPQLVNGKPRVLYIGAEYCPYCAVERLALVSALSRFGTFSGLKDTLSSPNEGQISNIPTVTFTNSTYTSDYLALTAVETQDRLGNKIADPTAADSATLTKYDTEGSIPFIYYGNAYSVGASYGGTFLAGQTADAVATALKDPTSDTAKAVLSGANLLTAQLCTLTSQKPTNVCTATGVVAAAKQLGK